MAIARRIAPAVLLFGMGAACTSANTIERPQVAPKTAPALLGPGDIFTVRVMGEEDLSGTYRVSNDGSIEMPLIGRIEVLHSSANETSDRIKAELRRFLKDPQVSIFVKEFNSQKIHVFGEVRRPGTFGYENGMSIVEAITLAGGFSRLAAPNRTSVTRMVAGNEKKMKIPVEDIAEGDSPNLELEPGDIVYVPETMF